MQIPSVIRNDILQKQKHETAGTGHVEMDVKRE